MDRLCKGLDSLGIKYNDEMILQFQTFYNMLIEKNKVMNLTSITELGEVIEKHFLDSVSIIKAYNIESVNDIIDVGTGGGFPGIPLKIVFPHLNITLLDSLNKRIQFLDEVVSELNLENVTTCHGRAEDFGRDELYREKYDLCVSRAVANLSSLSEYCLPFVKVGGHFVSYKSGNSDEEIVSSKGAIKKLSGKIVKIERFNLPESDISRSFILIKKYEKMSDKYPRKSGMPTKKPL